MQISTVDKNQVYPSWVVAFIEKLKSKFLAVSCVGVALILSPIVAAQSVTIVEYYNRPLDAYFITSRANEQALLDANSADFLRTGMRFTTASGMPPDANLASVCRYYISLATPYTRSHFYGITAADCFLDLSIPPPTGFSYEGQDFFVMKPTNGACPTGAPVPVRRNFRPAIDGRTPNHRYSVSMATYNAMVAAGWSAEGIAFCVPASADVVSASSASFKQVVSAATTPFAAGCNPGSGTLYSGAEVEPSLAINPNNKDHLLASWQQDRWSNGGSQGLDSAASFDGGLSWKRSAATFSRCAGGTAANNGDYRRASDPWSTLAPDGTAYLMALQFSGSSFAADGVSAMAVARSADGGRTWGVPLPLQRDAGAEFFNDKNTLLADPYDARFVYAVWGRLKGNGNGPAFFARSTDGGTSWEPARSIFDPGAADQTFGNYLVMSAPTASAPNGVLLNAFMRFSRNSSGSNTLSTQMFAMRSLDRGATWSTPVFVGDYLGVPTREPDDGSTVRDGGGLPSVAAGPDGRFHMVWQDTRFTGGAFNGIVYSQSSDGGQSWSSIASVNARPDVRAFMPTVAVRTDGTIGVSYFDFRNNVPGGTIDTSYRLATSTDGVHWSESSIEDTFDLDRAPVANGRFLGDYMGLSSNGAAFGALYVRSVAGADNNNRTEVVFANVADGSLKRASAASKQYVAATSPAFTPDAALLATVHAGAEAAQRARLPRQ